MNHPVDTPSEPAPSATGAGIASLWDSVEFSFTAQLNADPAAISDGRNHAPREVRSGHCLPVALTPIATPEYVSHRPGLFGELGLSEELAQNDTFRRIFSCDLSGASAPFKAAGWTTGYALSICGTACTQQCPFVTGSGCGDGRAIS